MSSLHLDQVLLAIMAAAALLGGWLALRLAYRARQTAGLPLGRVVYADTGDWRSPDKSFYSATYGLTGKPDYLVETRAGLIPVEVKSSATPPQPHTSHILQLAAYCLLVEETQGRSPPYGLIRYSDAVFEVDYTSGLRRELLAVLDAMRQASSHSSHPGRIPRSHNEPRRCAGCGYRPMCDQSLV